MTATAPEIGTRSRLARAALELFAEKGFRGTTVGEIEAAAGLVPRRGALYKHFASKDELFAAALEAEAEKLDQMPALDPLPPLGDVRAQLVLIGRWALARMADERQLLRIVERDGHRFPLLARRFYEQIVVRGHERAVAWIRGQVRSGSLPAMDVDARAVVAVGALVSYERTRAMFGEVPGGVDEERFIREWVRSLLPEGGRDET